MLRIHKEHFLVSADPSNAEVEKEPNSVKQILDMYKAAEIPPPGEMMHVKLSEIGLRDLNFYCPVLLLH